MPPVRLFQFAGWGSFAGSARAAARTPLRIGEPRLASAFAWRSAGSLVHAVPPADRLACRVVHAIAVGRLDTAGRRGAAIGEALHDAAKAALRSSRAASAGRCRAISRATPIASLSRTAG